MSSQDLNVPTPISKQRDSPEKNISDLPNEILILIFQFLNCVDLIKGVRLVCTRWQDLASHHSIWTSVQVKAVDVGSALILEKILSTTSVLDTLDLSRTRVREATLSTILSNMKVIRKLIVTDCSIERNCRNLLMPVVHHLRENVEALSFELNDSCFPLSTEERILGRMPKLRSLTLVGSLVLKENVDSLKLESPLLEKLDISRFETRAYCTRTDRHDLSSNIITRNKESLKAIYFPTGWGTAPMTDELGYLLGCRFLTVISLPLDRVQVVSHLPLIETLMVHCDHGSQPPKTWTRPKALKELVLTLREPSHDCTCFLREIRPPALTLVSDRLCRELEHYLSQSVKRLTLRCHYLRLRHLTVTLGEKKTLPGLEYLDVRECFLNKGVPPQILARLRSTFPSITIRSDRFLGYQKAREKRYNVWCSLADNTDCSDTD